MSVQGGINFRNRGDWLVWNATGPWGDFQMSRCIQIITYQGKSEGWAYSLNQDDVVRILARYKEHVSFWNAGTALITSELVAFSVAVGRSYQEIATLFNSLEPKRIPFET